MIKHTLFLLTFLLTCLHAGAVVRLTDAEQRLLIGKELYCYQPATEMSFEQVMRHADSFKRSESRVPNFGLSKHSIWLRFSVTNETDHRKLLLDLDYFSLNEVELYVPGADGQVETVFLGKSKPFSQRIYKHPTYIFDLNVGHGDTQTFFLRVKGDEQIFLPIYVNVPKVQFESISNDKMLSGLYMGIILIMVLYNFFVYLSVRDKSYIYYVIYISCVGLTQLGIKGYNYQYFWPGAPGFEQVSIILFGSISGIAALLFTRSFLEIRFNFRKFNIFIMVLIALFSLAIVLTLAGLVQAGFSAMQMVTSITALGIFVISLVVMLKGNRSARFFFLAWVALLAGSVIFLLKDFGILPYNTFTSYSVQAAAVIEISLLSFGLADRINTLKKEKELSQANALSIAKENERIIREQNINLEIKVNERTLELKESNTELNRTLDDLKQAQTQLVESEKMASLGQLTAGIAHEINNPINFVTSNVTPLKRDVGMLFEAIDTIEEVGMSALTASEKQQKIEAYKEELDYDYLKIEINHLLKGIYEGASRTAEIVKGLRIFSRVDEDDLKKADVNEGIDSTIVIINNLLNNRIEIVRNYGELPLIECYPGKLNQVFLNIISNAIHAVGKHFGDNTGGEITITTTTDGKDVFIRIKDNGIGMDDKTRSKIFEPFFTTKDVGEGTGLGMSIAYNTIKKHNGAIHVESQPGKGAEFIIRLPVIFDVPAIA